jgi:hypothetical protein
MHHTDEDALTEAIFQLASEYGQYGYPRITSLLQEGVWHVGKRPKNRKTKCVLSSWGNIYVRFGPGGIGGWKT